MKLSHLKPFQKDDGSMMTGQDIQTMVQDFVAQGKGKPGARPNLHDPHISQYHARQDELDRAERDRRATGNMEESEPDRKDDDRPWRRDAPPINRASSNPDYPTKPFDRGEWMRNSKPMEEEVSQVPEPGDTIRTRKMQMEGIVEKIGHNRAGYEEVYFRVADGRLMKTPLSNAIVVQKLADEDQETSEGTMGGISRCAPAVDVSYEHVLDEVMGKWEEERVDELGVDTLRNYVQKTSRPNPKDRLGKVLKHTKGHEQAVQKIANQTGDRTRGQGPSRTYEERLAEFVDIEEAYDKDEFADILGKQHQEVQAAKKKPTADIPFHGWTIRYRPASNPGEKIQWQIMDKKGDIKHRGESMTDKDAVSDAEDWIKSGGGTKQEATNKVTIDFNVDFAKQFAPGGEQFYAAIDKNGNTPMLIISTELQNGLKASHIRTQKDKITANTTRLPMISMSPKEANEMGLQPNGRYVLGPKDPIDANTAMFPLIFQSVVQGKGDIMKMGKPGLTVAHSRD